MQDYAHCKDCGGVPFIADSIALFMLQSVGDNVMSLEPYHNAGGIEKLLLRSGFFEDYGEAGTTG
ncbi:MAG: hypothetical protein CSB23_05610 [Deltaproteobacteria bacterium]|nr:MAG: hypothetical protein CSB23_05610 [Deltaproteobacteria bacterium]